MAILPIAMPIAITRELNIIVAAPTFVPSVMAVTKLSTR